MHTYSGSGGDRSAPETEAELAAGRKKECLRLKNNLSASNRAKVHYQSEMEKARRSMKKASDESSQLLARALEAEEKLAERDKQQTAHQATAV